MESLTMQENLKNQVYNTGNIENESSEQFQNFIYELFDRNGVLNDLRSYLRGHIVHLLNSAQSGEPPLCQKRFIQRLDITLQSINVLIAEYLLKQEFQYSLSVFLSELPLTNMVFEFTKSLLNYKNLTESNCLKFTEGDICSIFNFLGIKCDSTDMEHVMKMYANPECPPLLLYILKYVHLHQAPSNIQIKESVITDRHRKNTEIQIPKFLHGRCRHRSSCKNCQTRYQKLREKYAKKNKEFKLAFMQLKVSYDSEIEFVREEERTKAEDVLKSQAEQLEEQVKELKRRYADREAALERDAKQTRRFVRGLARRLRARLATVLDAATALRDERRRLNIKEENLKRELTLAEEILSSQGEQLRLEICNELAALEGHLDAMKRERDTINKERTELENMKQKNDERKKDQELKMNYEVMKEELAILKEHLKSFESTPKAKQTVSKEVLTDNCAMSNAVFSQNNGQDYNKRTHSFSDSRDSEKVIYNNAPASNPPKKVINDFRKEKNVNITTDAQVQASVEDSRSSVWPMISRDLLMKLSEQWCSETSQLKMLAAQQGTHLEYLAAQQAKLRAELESRHKVARAPQPTQCLPAQTRINERAELGISAPAPVARTLSAMVKRRCQPHELCATVYAQPPKRALHSSLESKRRVLLNEQEQTDANATPECLKEKINSQSIEERKSSQDSVLQEAIIKLKKLEIEAEAVEDAYLDFRKRHAERVTSLQLDGCQQAVKTLQDPLLNMPDAKKVHPIKNRVKPVSYYEDTKNLFRLHHKTDHNVKEYSASLKRYDISEKQKTEICNLSEKPIQSAPDYRNKMERVYNENLLETPLLEFRKYYYASGSLQYVPIPESSKVRNSYIVPIVKDTATSPATFLDTERLPKMASMCPKEDQREFENEGIKQLEHNLKKMYVSNIKKRDETDVTSETKHRMESEGENMKHYPSEIMEKPNIPNNLDVTERESDREEEIRQVDLTNVRNDSSSTSSESEVRKSASRTRRSSVESGIKKTESKLERPEISNSLIENDLDEKVLTEDSEKPSDSGSIPAISQKLIYDAVNGPFDSTKYEEEHSKDNGETAFSTNNSPDDLTDVNRSDSPISVEKYSSVDNFWQ